VHEGPVTRSIVELGDLVVHGERTEVELSRVGGQPFGEALRASVKASSAGLELRTPSRAAVAAGDVLLASFYFRTEWSREERGEGEVEFVFELRSEPWTQWAAFQVRAGRDWKRVSVPFVVRRSLLPGEARIRFRLGFFPQTVEIGGIELENFGREVKLGDLPATEISYRGREPDADWRRAAAQRIDQIRKAELELRVEDPAGQAIEGAKVRARLARHEFAFGTCVQASRLVGPGEERYRGIITELFNFATLENDLKWPALEGDWNEGYPLDRAQAAVEWLGAQGIRVRGHVLVWPGWRNLPRSLQALEREPARLRGEVERHVRELASLLRGKLAHWDVLNEPFDNHDLMDILGREVMIDWFRAARAADPQARLFINDYAILAGGGGRSPHRDDYLGTIRLLVEGGAPLDGIGMQGHFGTTLTAPQDLLSILDRFAEFGKPIFVTEYDIDLGDEALAAEYTHDFYTTLFSHPAVGGILMWGFWDGAHWKSNAPLYRRDWSLKPAGRVFRDLVLGAWHTDERGQTDGQGSFGVRGFLGEYVIEVQALGRTVATQVRLETGGARIAIVLG
jgi:GH35 family endo-1,4-beta-xylanase